MCQIYICDYHLCYASFSTTPYTSHDCDFFFCTIFFLNFQNIQSQAHDVQRLFSSSVSLFKWKINGCPKLGTPVRRQALSFPTSDDAVSFMCCANIRIYFFLYGDSNGYVPRYKIMLLEVNLQHSIKSYVMKTAQTVRSRVILRQLFGKQEINILFFFCVCVCMCSFCLFLLQLCIQIEFLNYIYKINNPSILWKLHVQYSFSVCKNLP